MSARSRTITLRDGRRFVTPLLIPSFSSMALGPILYTEDPGTKPRPTVCSVVHSDTLVQGIEESLLISAYDIHYGLLKACETLGSGFEHSPYAGPRLLIIDSGWYEKESGYAGNGFVEGVELPQPWEETNYAETIDNLDPDVHPIAVSWDYSGQYRDQILRAQDFFGARQHVASTILLKRPGDSRFHNFRKLSGQEAADLRVFEIVGVTEKELGDTILDRLVAVGQLRELLDGQGVDAPIHVFGGLDPLLTPLYFAAGAEIFDGLGWLRYAYSGGLAINRDAGALLSLQVDKRWSQVMTKLQRDNLDALRELAGDLRVFAHNGGKWIKLRKGKDLQTVYERFVEQLGRPHGR